MLRLSCYRFLALRHHFVMAITTKRCRAGLMDWPRSVANSQSRHPVMCQQPTTSPRGFSTANHAVPCRSNSLPTANRVARVACQQPITSTRGICQQPITPPNAVQTTKSSVWNNKSPFLTRPLPGPSSRKRTRKQKCGLTERQIKSPTTVTREN